MTIFYDNQENHSVLKWKGAYLRSVVKICLFLMYERKLSTTKFYNNQGNLSARVEGSIPEEMMDHHPLRSLYFGNS